MLPGMSGIELCQKIRLSARTSQIPIIAVSTQVQGDTVNASLKSGANTFVKKPFLPKELVAVVQHYMTEAAQAQGANVARELPLVVL